MVNTLQENNVSLFFNFSIDINSLREKFKNIYDYLT